MEQACRELVVSRSGYYAWLGRGPSERSRRNQALRRRLVELHEKYPAMGLDSLHHMLTPEFGCSRNRVHRERLEAYGIRQRMSPKGDPYDNAVAENFFSCLKCELIHLKQYPIRAAAQNDVFAYLETFYNTVRPHSALGWISPTHFEAKLALPPPESGV